MGSASIIRACRSTLAHGAVGSALDPRPLGSTWDHRPYSSSRLPHPAGSTSVSHDSAITMDFQASPSNPPAPMLHLVRSSPWLHLILPDPLNCLVSKTPPVFPPSSAQSPLLIFMALSRSSPQYHSPVVGHPFFLQPYATPCPPPKPPPSPHHGTRPQLLAREIMSQLFS